MHSLTEQAFSRSSSAPLIPGNHVRLLRDGDENYPAWLQAIRGAQRHIHFENYILADDAVGNRFADALIERAKAGVQVRVLYDWLGSFRKASRTFWGRLRAGGVDLRCYNPPRLESPLGWVTRDHRKLLTADGSIGFVSGLCVAWMWSGDPAKSIGPWRDTGVELRGPAVAELERSFAQMWATLGEPLPDRFLPREETPFAGQVNVRIVASDPATSATFRLDQLVVAFARQRVWLTDAYYLGAPTYVQALTTAARDGVDVRMLMPRATDLPLLKVASRVGYRPLLEAGVRIFEWNRSVLHAKTAVVDGRWARVGSTNLNIASWLANYELDAVIEDEPFAQQMEAMYLDDLTNATEVVLEARRRLRAPRPTVKSPSRGRRGRAARAAAGAVRFGNVVGAALTSRRVFDPLEARLLVSAAIGLLTLAGLAVLFPAALAYPIAALMAWGAVGLLFRSLRLRRNRPPRSPAPRDAPWKR
jgi:cardiolipin synthase A/B